MVKIIKTETEFNEIINEGKVVVDFFATWCGPCRMFAPVYEEVSNQLSTITFLKVDIDEIENLPKKYGIMSVPTLLLFENGQVIKQTSGYMEKEDLIEFLS